MLEKSKNKIMENRSLAVAEVVLTILLVFMFQYIMGCRKEYAETSAEPTKTEQSIILKKDEPFIQYMVCQKDSLQGIMVLAEAEAGMETGLSVQILDDAGQMLADAGQTVSAGEEYTLIPFGKTVSGCTGKRLQIVFRTDADISVILKGGSCEGILDNGEVNACVKLVYQALDIGKYKISVYAGGSILWIFLSICLIMLVKKKAKPEYIFVFLYLTMGIIYMAINPLYAIPDEPAHFMRIYGISEGSFITESQDGDIGTGSVLPENLLAGNKFGNMKIMDIVKGKDIELSQEKVYKDYWNTALYSPFTYIVQVFGVMIGKLFSSKIFFIAYCGRFMAWLAAGCILFFAIRYIPFGKNTLIAVSLLPMNMHESISLAGDTFTFAVAVAFFSFVLYLRYTYKSRMGMKQYVLLYILLFFLASCKIVYVPLCMLAFLIPVERFGNRQNYWKHVLLSVFEVLLTSGIWMGISMRILNGQSDGKSAEQIQYILHDPLAYIETIVNTTISNGEVLIKTMIGSSLGWLSITVNTGIIVMVVSNLIYMCVRETGIWQDEQKKWPRIWTMGSVVCVIIVMYTSLYVQWTDLKKHIIDGLQGRYFLPLLFPFILALKRGGLIVDEETGNNSFCVSYLILLLTNIFTLVTLLTNYII